MAIPPPLSGGEKKYWWLSNRKIVEKYVKEARALIASHDQAEITCALNHLDAALALYPKFEDALELKARSLLYLRRYKEVADMLQEYIPSIKIESEDSSLSSESSSQLYKERAKLLPDNSSEGESGFKCFSVADLKKKVMAGLCMHSEKEGHWRYSVVGQACYRAPMSHLVAKELRLPETNQKRTSFLGKELRLSERNSKKDLVPHKRA